jgi:hypothetical protein
MTKGDIELSLDTNRISEVDSTLVICAADVMTVKSTVSRADMGMSLEVVASAAGDPKGSLETDNRFGSKVGPQASVQMGPMDL